MTKRQGTDDPLADAVLTPRQRAAWENLRADHMRLQEQLAQLLAEKVEAESEAAAPGTMLLSRLEFSREVARLLALEERYGGTSSLIYFDCANLDAQPRPARMAAVRAMGAALLGQVRGCDIAGRLDDHEFGVLLVRCGNDDAWRKAEILAGQLREAAAAMPQYGFDLDVGFGAYTFTGGDDVLHGIKAASKAMTGKKK